jgi:site-specific DNA-methyltransferase (adenine-specific)
VIIAGHTRLLAAQSLGLAEVPVRVARGLSPEQVRAYRLADNRSAEESEWDEALLAGELGLLEEAGFDLALTAFDPDELQELLEPPAITPEAADAAGVGPARPEAVTKRGDRIVLGHHVLVCGDATEVGSWEALLGTERPMAMWTDPPYGVSVVGGTADQLTIENDGGDVAALTQLLRSSLGLASGYLRPGGACFIAGPHGPTFLAFATALTELGIWRETLVWVKDRFVLSRQDFHWQHEVIFAGAVPETEAGEVLALDDGEPAAKEFTPVAYGWKPGGPHTWLGDRTQTTVIEVARPASSREHPTMKPVALIDPLIRLTVPPSGLVIDPFAGSGSTLIACETSGRHARCIELSPSYCDVIVTRWEQATGQVAVRP